MKRVRTGRVVWDIGKQKWRIHFPPRYQLPLPTPKTKTRKPKR